MPERAWDQSSDKQSIVLEMLMYAKLSQNTAKFTFTSAAHDAKSAIVAIPVAPPWVYV